MQKTKSMARLTVAALLIAVGIVIPMFSPIKFVLEPASFTLASHVAIFIAMFISPPIAAVVALGTAAGFLLGGFPIIIVLRAASHMLFAIFGAFYLNTTPDLLASPLRTRLFSFVIGIIHAVCEVAVVSAFYFSGTMSQSYYENGFLTTVMMLVGVGTIIHSMIDFEIAFFIFKALKKNPALATIFSKKTEL